MAVLKVNKTYPSLNDYTDTGPTLTAGILGILLQFRRHKEGLVADMQKAFLNMGADDESKAFELYRETDASFAAGSFKLRKSASNGKAVINKITQDIEK